MEQASSVHTREGQEPSASRTAVESLEARLEASERRLQELSAGHGDLEAQVEALAAQLAAAKAELAGVKEGAANPETAAKPAEAAADPAQQTTGSTVPTAAADVREVSDLNGRMGRLVVQFVEGCETSGTLVRAFAGSAPTGEPAIYDHGGLTAELLAGIYCLEINGLRAGPFEVKPRHETRVHTGVLRARLSSGTYVRLHEPGGAEELFGFYGTRDLGLPVGKVEVEVAGQRELVSIDKDKVQEL